MAQELPKKPEKVFRIRSVSAWVFLHEVETEFGKSTKWIVSVRKQYLDGEDIKHISSFAPSELSSVIRVLQWAQEYIQAREAEVTDAWGL